MALQLGTCAASCAAWCCCSAVCSTLSSCCGSSESESASSPGPTSGRKRSVFLLFFSVCLQFLFQFGLAQYVVDNFSGSSTIRKAWLDACEVDDINDTYGLQQSCVGNAGSYRVAAVTTLFFSVMALITCLCKPTANREAWPFKIILYLALVGSTVVVPNDPIFTPIYRSIAIVGGVLFICMQQLVILDCSYAWNDSWVEKSNKAEAIESGSGKKWLAAILLSCAIFIFGTFAALVYMFREFTGCTTNNLFISLTLIFCVLMPIAQMTGDEGSLLGVSCISAWATYLCFTAVTKNPDATCNPRFGESSPISIAFGLIMTLLSLGWAGWSYTAEDKFTDITASTGAASKEEVSSVKSNAEVDIEMDGNPKPRRAVAGVVVTQSGTEESLPDACGNADDSPNSEAKTDTKHGTSSTNAWKLNVALAVVSCWSAMTMTQWGVVQSNDGTIANRSIGRVGMWVIIGSQWFVMTLYLWTLIAPRLFPDRDFG